jgi:hypothetical protein
MISSIKYLVLIYPIRNYTASWSLYLYITIHYIKAVRGPKIRELKMVGVQNPCYAYQIFLSPLVQGWRSSEFPVSSALTPNRANKGGFSSIFR